MVNLGPKPDMADLVKVVANDLRPNYNKLEPVDLINLVAPEWAHKESRRAHWTTPEGIWGLEQKLNELHYRWEFVTPWGVLRFKLHEQNRMVDLMVHMGAISVGV